MRPRTRNRKIYGIGVNDAPYQVSTSAMVDGKQKNTWICPFYVAWTGMMKRCYSEKYHASRPTYRGCSVTEEWKVFSSFREWMSGQDWKGKQLDKDLLFPGNKIYSPETCVMVSLELNNFLAENAYSKSRWPVGVSWHPKTKKFRARCNNPFASKDELIGYFNCPNEAHMAWLSRKHELACIYAEMQTDRRLADALRLRYLRRTGDLR